LPIFGFCSSYSDTTSPNFFQPLQQARSDQLVKAVVDWIGSSAYSSIISAIEVVNEPRPYTTEQRAMLRAFYDRSYDTIQTLGSKAPAMFFADVRISNPLVIMVVTNTC
jgi:hypothetical protein